MNQTTLLQGEPWMTPQERDLNRNFIQSSTLLLAARGVPETPLILIRVNDVIATWLLARRLELALTPEPGEPAPCPTPAQAGAIGKCRDRLRRAMKELEACCPRDAHPVSPGLFEIMHTAAQQHSETEPGNENAEAVEPQTAECESPETSRNPSSALKTATPEAAPTQPGTSSTGAAAVPQSTPTTNPPPPSPRRLPRKKRRKKRGIPIRQGPP